MTIRPFILDNGYTLGYILSGKRNLRGKSIQTGYNFLHIVRQRFIPSLRTERFDNKRYVNIKHAAITKHKCRILYHQSEPVCDTTIREESTSPKGKMLSNGVSLSIQSEYKKKGYNYGIEENSFDLQF